MFIQGLSTAAAVAAAAAAATARRVCDDARETKRLQANKLPKKWQQNIHTYTHAHAHTHTHDRGVRHLQACSV